MSVNLEPTSVASMQYAPTVMEGTSVNVNMATMETDLTVKVTIYFELFFFPLISGHLTSSHWFWDIMTTFIFSEIFKFTHFHGIDTCGYFLPHTSYSADGYPTALLGWWCIFMPSVVCRQKGHSEKGRQYWLQICLDHYLRLEALGIVHPNFGMLVAWWGEDWAFDLMTQWLWLMNMRPLICHSWDNCDNH